MPVGHLDSVGVQARWREDRVGGTAGWAGEFGRGYGFDVSRQAGVLHDFPREVVPGAIAGVGCVHDAARLLTAEFDESGCEIDRERGGAALIVDYGNFSVRGCQLQNGRGKALATVAEKPRSAHDANFGQDIEQAQFRARLGITVNAGRISLVSGFVWGTFGAIENVVGAKEQQTGTDTGARPGPRGRGLRNSRPEHARDSIRSRRHRCKRRKE